MIFETLVFFTVQPLDPADSQRKFNYTQSSGKQQILLPHQCINFMVLIQSFNMTTLN
jgi:hypothetical protein